MKNYNHLVYTFLHRKAILYTIHKLIKDENLKQEMLKRAAIHDLDKAVLYTLIGKKEASVYHRMTAAHHMDNNIPKSYEDYVEAVIDYESAGYTKEDKPLNAYDTVRQYHPKHEEELLKVIRELGIDSSYKNSDDEDFKNFISIYLPVTEEMVLEEIYTYLATTDNNIFTNDNWKKIISEIDYDT